MWDQYKLKLPCGAVALLRAWILLYPEREAQFSQRLDRVRAFIRSRGLVYPVFYGFNDVCRKFIAERLLGINYIEHGEQAAALDGASPRTPFLATTSAHIFIRDRTTRKIFEEIINPQLLQMISHTVLIEGHTWMNYIFDNSLHYMPVNLEEFTGRGINRMEAERMLQYFLETFHGRLAPGNRILLSDHGEVPKRELKRYLKPYSDAIVELRRQ